MTTSFPRSSSRSVRSKRRDESRLLVFDRANGAVEHRRFRDLRSLMPSANARRRERHARASCPAHTRAADAAARTEVLLLERIEGDMWEALARPSRRLQRGHEARARRAPRVARRGPLARSASRVSRTAKRRFRPTSLSRSRMRSATRPSTRRRAARRPRRRPGSTSRPSSWPRSTSSGSRSTSVSTRSGPSPPRRSAEHRLHSERYEVGRAGVGADRGGAARDRGGDDDGAGARVARARGTARGAHRASSSRPGSSSVGWTRS